MSQPNQITPDSSKKQDPERANGSAHHRVGEKPSANARAGTEVTSRIGFAASATILGDHGD